MVRYPETAGYVRDNVTFSMHFLLTFQDLPVKKDPCGSSLSRKPNLVKNSVEEEATDAFVETSFGNPLQCTARGGHCEVARLILK